MTEIAYRNALKTSDDDKLADVIEGAKKCLVQFHAEEIEHFEIVDETFYLNIRTWENKLYTIAVTVSEREST